MGTTTPLDPTDYAGHARALPQLLKQALTGAVPPLAERSVEDVAEVDNMTVAALDKEQAATHSVAPPEGMLGGASYGSALSLYGSNHIDAEAAEGKVM